MRREGRGGRRYLLRRSHVQRVTISINEDLGATFDRLLRARGYGSRSEGVRDLVREAVEAWNAEQLQGAHAVGTLSFIYDRQTRALAQRLSELQHDHHDLISATTQVHLDHDHALEAVMLKGEAGAVRAFADQVRAQRGVKFAQLNLVSVERDDAHANPSAHRHHGHDHLTPTQG